MTSKSELNHVDKEGKVVMVNVSEKAKTTRIAKAAGSVVMRKKTMQQIRQGNLKKGDPFTVARLAGIMGAKKTHELIPLCHPLSIDHIELDLKWDVKQNTLNITATCQVDGKTGVEMEAMTAVSVAALTVYDMCKAIDREIRLTEIKLISKSGGSSGDFRA